MEEREPPLDKMRTSSSPGSRSWVSMYTSGSVRSESLEPTMASEDDAYPPLSPKHSSEIMDSRQPVQVHPIDIFSNSHGHSAPVNDFGSAQRISTNKPTLKVLHCPKLRQTVGDSKLLITKLESLGILSTRSRRLASRTDHPINYDAAVHANKEGLNHKNKIRSSFCRWKPTQSFDDQEHKAVSFDPAIIFSGSEKPIVTPKPAFEKSIQPLQPTAQKSDSGRFGARRDQLRESFQSVLLWKKHDRVKLQEFLDLLNRIEESSPFIDSPLQTVRRLNPRAPEFDGSSCASSCSNKDNDGHPKLCKLPVFTRANRPSLPLISQRKAQPSNRLAKSAVPTFPRFPPYHTLLQNIPLQLTTDDGHGREAVVDLVDPAWGNSVLENFRARYPLTGKLKASPPAKSNGRLAATIQQRLEYILMEKRERNGLARNFQEENQEYSSPTLMRRGT